MTDPSADHPYDALRELLFVRRKRAFTAPALRRKSIALVDHLERLDDVEKLTTLLIA
jgi:hypothetical protein